VISYSKTSLTRTSGDHPSKDVCVNRSPCYPKTEKKSNLQHI